MMVDKASIRKKFRERQNSLLKLEKQYNSDKVLARIMGKDEFANAQVIMAFMAMDHEPNMDPLIAVALNQGKTVCIPVCCMEFKLKAAVPNDWDQLKPNALGIPEPVEGEFAEVDPEVIDLVLVPGVAFDSQCNRMGHGSGYYDRFLKRLRSDAVKLGVCFETQLYKQIPAEVDLDIPMDLVVTDVTTYRRVP